MLFKIVETDSRDERPLDYWKANIKERLSIMILIAIDYRVYIGAGADIQVTCLDCHEFYSLQICRSSSLKKSNHLLCHPLRHDPVQYASSFPQFICLSKPDMTVDLILNR